MASATSPAGSMPENLEPDRSRVMSMLSGFANACLHEMAPHPAIAKELEVTKAENAALTRENKLLKADVKKLWQDNETLNSSLKQTAAERDHFKATTENLQAILSQSKEPLQALCLQLQQENDWVKRQHDVLRATTERLVNDGLQLGVLVNTNTTNNGKSQKIIGFRHPTQTPHRVPVSSPHRVRGVQPPQNLHQQQGNISSTTQVPSQNAFPPSVHSQPQQKRVSVSRQTAPVPYPYQQSQSPVDNVRHQSAGSSHLSPQQASQSQYIVHRSQQNHQGSVSPIEQQFVVPSHPGVSSHTDQPTFRNALPHAVHDPRLTSPNFMATAQGLHYGNPYATHPVQPQSWTQPQPPSSSPHMQSRRSSHPQIQQEPRSRSHSPFRPALTQRSSSSPHPLSQVQMPPQQQSAPFETQMQRHSVQSQPAPEGLHLLSHALQPIPIDLLSPTEHLQPPSTSDAQIAPASAPSGNTEKSIAGPAPPTPPRSIKSLSPEQEQHHCLPFTRAQPMKRGSIDMDYDAKEEDMSSKRMRLEDGSGHAIDSHLSEVVQEVSAMQGIEQGRTPLTPTAPGWPAERTPEGVAQVQDVQSSECTEYMEQDASNKKEDFVTDDLMNVPSKPSQSMVAQGRSDGEGPGTPGSGEDQADENEAEGESDDESEGNPEAEALEVVLKLEDSKKFCTLCRSRREKVPNKYGDTFFDLDTPSWILVEHFSTTHSSAWNKLLGTSDAA